MCHRSCSLNKVSIQSCTQNGRLRKFNRICIIIIVIIIIIIIIMKKVDKNRIYRQIEDGQNGWYK